jgi:DNA-binding SARP family transcriptional activator/TolB-like protein/Tfp pilus assembly protein PilF
MLRFYTLGSFELLDGDPPAVRLVPTQSKRLALLAYLALALPRGFHRRDTLLALFWPELSDEDARRALRQALHHLRRAVGVEAIETRPDDQVRLREGALWCDALAFEEASAAGRPGEALALYRNAFLAGVHVPEVSVELEQWIEHTRDRLHQAAGRAAAALSLQAEQAGDLGRAAEAARAAHDLHPDDEASARRLMHLLDRRGDRARALQVYERLVRRLASEYQTTPSAETASLARSLRDAPPVEPRSSQADMADPLNRLQQSLADRYAIERELGHGGMAVVMLARDLKHQRRVAIKVLRPEVSRSLGTDRFLREIEVAAQLTHPHILPVFDSGAADGLLYYVMPYVEGGSLRAWLQREPQLSVEAALRLTCQVAQALEYAHDRGVVHRDIKPENILLESGEPVIADYGLALAVSVAGGARLTESGLALGTPAYMSPEQAAGDLQIDGRADLYSLGCVLYEMLAGEPPFTGPGAQAIMAKRLGAPAPLIRVVREGVPVAVERAIDRVLAKVPADRFRTAGEFTKALSQPAVTPRRRSLNAVRRWGAAVGLAAVAVAVLLAGVALAVHAWRPAPPTLLSTGRLAAHDRVVVADFESHSRDSLLADVVTAGIRLELSQSPLIRVLSPAAVRAARRRMQDPDPQAALSDTVAQLLAVREGVGLIVQGNVASVGREWLVSAQLVGAGTGEPLGMVRETAADSSHLFETIDRVANGLRARIGESSRALRAEPPLRQLTTGSLQALRRWSDAQTAQYVEGDRPKARRLLEEATALDTSFALAWRALSVLYGSLGPPEAMVDAATRAHNHRDRLTDRERHLVDAEYHMVVTQDFAKAFAAYDSQLVVTPHDPGLLGASAYLHFRLREFDESERLYRHALEADSSLTPVYSGLIESQINLGRLDRARVALGAFRAHFPDNRFDEWEEIYLAAATGAYDSAGTHARRLLAAAPDDADHRGEAIRTLANLALLRGRLAESTRLRRQAMSVYEANGDLAGYWLEVATLATGEVRLARRPDEARRIVADALRRHPLDSLPPGARPYVQLGVVYAGLGDLDRAAEMQAALERLGLARGRFAEAQWRRLRGTILLARRRYLEAQAELRLAAEREECALCSLPALGRSYDLAGRADSAAAVYERYLRTPWMKRLELDATELGAVSLRLGELYQERGDRGTAAAMYRRVAALWHGADGELGRAAVRATEQARAE